MVKEDSIIDGDVYYFYSDGRLKTEWIEKMVINITIVKKMED